MKRILIAGAVSAVATLAVAEGIAPADVVYGEYGSVAESLSGVPGDPENGRVVMTTRGLGNCIACHQVTDLEEFPFHGGVGPSLDGVGDRWQEADLRGIVSNAKLTFPESVMPAFYVVDGFNRPGDGFTGQAASGPLDPLLSAQDIEDVVAYLMTLKYED